MPLGNTLFVKSNRATALSGVGAHLSALTAQTSASSDPTNYPASNVLEAARYIVAAFGPGDVTIEVDLGSPTTVDIVGVLNVMNPLDGATHTGINPVNCKVWMDTVTPVLEDDATRLVAILNFSQNANGNFRKTPRDMLAAITPTTKRYIKYKFLQSFDGLLVGSVVAGRVLDMGRSYAAGSSEDPIYSRIRPKAVSGADMPVTVGPNRMKAQLQFPAITRAMLDNLFATFQVNPIPLILPGGDAAEFDLDTDTLTTKVVWGNPELWDCTVEGTSLA